ncbi:hypothetical protein O9Z70_06435 [Devosia sp. YIM 151766]|uniref:hypothetical protein n=1 Tax=Devosia sp. YIM 151766 TaxID=3017325 RepID=UPI00255C508A|nr:hypothetical protein [Devosia sp. YIM 151766]WIY54155.1 hypothetical protein O9Z70_06435 [Devosia sp. YIM 151766]
MTCKECQERREAVVDAVLEGRIAAAAGHLVKGAAEMVGLKPKTATTEYEELAGQGEAIQIDAGDPPMPPVKKPRAKRS